MKTEEFLEKLYEKNFEELSEPEKQQYIKDKKFITKYIAEINKVKESYSHITDPSEYGITESRFYKIMLEQTKEKYDSFTIINNWIESTAKLLKEDSFIINNMDEFYRLMDLNDEKQKENCNVSRISKHISLDSVIDLTKGFLQKIDPSETLLSEFEKFNEEKRIKIDCKNSKYNPREDIVEYNFDGTVNTAMTLVHEFMHRVHYTHGNPNSDREAHSMFLEYPSIFYEIGMIDYIKEQGFIDENEAISLKGSRLKSQYERTSSEDFSSLLRLCRTQIENGKITEDDILTELGEKTSDDTFDEVTKNLVSYCNEYIFTSEHTGLIMYKLSTALAIETPQTPFIQQNLYKIATQYIVDKESDDDFISARKELLLKSKEEQPYVNVNDIGKKTLIAQKDSESKKIVENVLTNWKEKSNERNI